MNAKYVNSLPLYRVEREFGRNRANLSRQVMAGWIIRCSVKYLLLLVLAQYGANVLFFAHKSSELLKTKLMKRYRAELKNSPFPHFPE